MLSWPKRFGGTLGLEEHRKRGGILGMACWFAAVVEDSCVISGKLVQSLLCWKISDELSNYMMNVLMDYPVIL